jgi:hypothetical protein
MHDHMKLKFTSESLSSKVVTAILTKQFLRCPLLLISVFGNYLLTPLSTHTYTRAPARRDAHVFKKSVRHLEIVNAERASWVKNHIEHQQIQGTTAQNVTAVTATWLLGYVHLCVHVSCLYRLHALYVSFAVGTGGERIVNVVPGRTELELQLRRVVGHAAHTHSNPHVKWGLLCVCVRVL